jgi:NADP-dependent 3-hydroxy acid dehydrogenase YdfG
VRLKGAVVVLTGASSGIGAATAVAFAKAGARLELGARRLDRLQAVADKCRKAGSPTVNVRMLDVGDKAQARAFVAAGLRSHERLDILVNNAGIGWFGPLQRMPDDKVEEMIATNFKGVVNMTQAALPWMLQRKRGVIINVASVAGFRASPYSAVYAATKHAVVGLSHALRGELSGTGVKVCVVYPYVTGGTEFFEHGGRAIGPQYSAQWVANLIVRTARVPRRDAIVAPFRLAHLAEPVFGGLIDHAIGEIRRRNLPEVPGSDLP